MDLHDCIAFALAHSICYLSSEGSDPAFVRARLTGFADERGFCFVTAPPRRFRESMHRDRKVEAWFFSSVSELPDATMLWVSGAVEFVDDAALAKKVGEESSAREGVIGAPREPITEVFLIGSGEARLWTQLDILREEDRLREHELETVSF